MLSALADPAAPWVPPGLWVPPRFATPRDPSRQSTGPAVAKIMRALGQPPMPWQTYTATVGGEVNACGLYVYPLVIVSVPRQSGKTALALAQAIHRCLQGPNRRAWFTAQTGQDARDKFRELVGLIMASPLRELVAGRPRLQNGAECLTFINGSTMRPHPPTRDALHGKQSDHNDVDEGWSFDEPTGADLFQAITPTQATRPGAQTWVWSTMGDASSTWFHALVARVLAGVPGVAGFIWGIPDDAPVDVETVAAHHPAVGHTQTVETLRAAAVVMGDKPSEYARAYGNRQTGGKERVFPEACWDAGRTELELPAGVPAYGVGVSKDGSSTAVMAAVADAQGRPWLEVLAHRPGRSWAVDFVTSLTDAGQGVAIHRQGSSAPVADALELAGVNLLPVNGIGYAAACQDFWDRLCDDAAQTGGDDGGPAPRLFYRDDEDLDAAVDVAGRRQAPEGGWVLSERESTGSIAVLRAAVLAAWAVARTEAPQTIGRSVFLT